MHSTGSQNGLAVPHNSSYAISRRTPKSSEFHMILSVPECFVADLPNQRLQAVSASSGLRVWWLNGVKGVRVEWHARPSPSPPVERCPSS